jgi:hypothetical protein
MATDCEVALLDIVAVPLLVMTTDGLLNLVEPTAGGVVVVPVLPPPPVVELAPPPPPPPPPPPLQAAVEASRAKHRILRLLIIISLPLFSEATRVSETCTRIEQRGVRFVSIAHSF